jgi:hypothetical protein
MRFNYGISALALTAALAVAPFAAKAELSLTQTATIAAAVDAAMSTGDTGKLTALLTQLTTANPNDAGAITDVVAQQISKDAANATTALIAGTESTVAEAVTSSAIVAIVAAAPGQAGTVLAEAQTNLTPDLTVAAVTATQTALAPAAGGNNQQQIRNDIKALVADLKALVQVIVQTAEAARRQTASPS